MDSLFDAFVVDNNFLNTIHFFIMHVMCCLSVLFSQTSRGDVRKFSMLKNNQTMQSFTEMFGVRGK